MLKNILDNQKLIWAFVVRELRGRYVGSVMGLFWSVIHPLSQIIVFSFVFSMINRGDIVGLPKDPNSLFNLNYTIYLCSGLLPWIAFSEFIAKTTNVFVSNANLIKKVHFPEEILIVQEVVSSMITMGISFSLFFIVIALFGGWTPGIHFLLLPGIVALQILFSLGLAFFIATLNVFLRDVGQIVGVMLLTWFWLTPIVYPASLIVFGDPDQKAVKTFADMQIPRWVHTTYTLNPWYYLSKWYRQVIYEGKVPEFNEVIAFVGLTIVIVAAGVAIFKALRKDIPDMI